MYLDADGDGYGLAGTGRNECSVSAGTSKIFKDCDDGDSGVHPGATETCDGTDEDCDGTVDDGLTCDGTEDCSNGEDDDGDGLTDCEDADCADDAACAGETACDDGSDNDGDGLTDCGDDDCWGSGECNLNIMSRVLGGTLDVDQTRRRRTYDGYGSIPTWYSTQSTIAAASVSGQARIYPGWPHTHSSARATCTWGFARHTQQHQRTYKLGSFAWHNSTLVASDVTGSWTDGDCPVPGSFLVPRSFGSESRLEVGVDHHSASFLVRTWHTSPTYMSVHRFGQRYVGEVLASSDRTWSSITPAFYGTFFTDWGSYNASVGSLQSGTANLHGTGNRVAFYYFTVGGGWW